MLKELLFAFRSLPDEMNKRVDSVVIRAHRPVEGPDGSAVCTNHWHGTQPWPCSAIRDRFPVGDGQPTQQRVLPTGESGMLHRQNITPQITLWSASANGQVLYWYTESDVTLTERPIFTDSVMGVELVDSQGQVVARAFTDRRPPLGTR